MTQDTAPILNLTALDGRYRGKTRTLASIMSEWGYIRSRVQVEIEWLIHLEHTLKPKIDDQGKEKLRSIYKNFTVEDGLSVKAHEVVTNHDVKALEYFIRDQLESDSNLIGLSQWIHFGLTSDDVNNIAHALMHRSVYQEVIRPELNVIEADVARLVSTYADAALMARTHGQPATPTTFGKEMAVFLNRLMDLREDVLDHSKMKAKLNGAVGCFNAFVVADSSVEWPAVSRSFIVDVLGLDYQVASTQIECHDYLAVFYRGLQSLCGAYIDLVNDLWIYIANDLLKLKVVANEVGSSTMPHKVNPINFENAEANFGIANALLAHLSNKLPVSRLQRDLSDSATLRAAGTALGHFQVGLSSLQIGLKKITFDRVAAITELQAHPSLLGEPIQTVLRMYAVPNSYEMLKDLTRGNLATTATSIDASRSPIEAFHASLVPLLDSPAVSEKVPETVRAELLALRPETYVGLAEQLAREILKRYELHTKA